MPLRALDAVAGDFVDVGDLSRGDACGFRAFGKRAGERVRGACGEGGGDSDRFERVIGQGDRFGGAEGQRAGLVEDDGVNLGQALQRGAVLDQQGPCGTGDRRRR